MKRMTKDNTALKFILVGILNTVVGYLLFVFFIFLGLHYSQAVLLATIFGVLFNFKSTGKLVFGNNDNGLIYRFVLVYMVLYLLNITGLWIFEKNGFMNMYISGFILIIPLAVASFILNRKYVFKG